MASAAESIAVAESDPNREEGQIQRLRIEYDEAERRINERRSELENLIQSIQLAKKAEHGRFRDMGE
jgi:hypothetical protein